MTRRRTSAAPSQRHNSRDRTMVEALCVPGGRRASRAAYPTRKNPVNPGFPARGRNYHHRYGQSMPSQSGVANLELSFLLILAPAGSGYRIHGAWESHSENSCEYKSNNPESSTTRTKRSFPRFWLNPDTTNLCILKSGTQSCICCFKNNVDPVLDQVNSSVVGRFGADNCRFAMACLRNKRSACPSARGRPPFADSEGKPAGLPYQFGAGRGCVPSKNGISFFDEGG